LKSEQVIDDVWLEEKMRDLLASMLRIQQALSGETGNLPAIRPSTGKSFGVA
jgi:hypothetical protein